MYFSFKHDISELKSKSQKIKGSFHVLTRRLSLMTILAMDYFRLTSIEFKLTLIHLTSDQMTTILLKINLLIQRTVSNPLYPLSNQGT